MVVCHLGDALVLSSRKKMVAPIMAMESSQNVPPTTSVGKSVSFMDWNFHL